MEQVRADLGVIAGRIGPTESGPHYFFGDLDGYIFSPDLKSGKA